MNAEVKVISLNLTNKWNTYGEYPKKALYANFINAGIKSLREIDLNSKVSVTVYGWINGMTCKLEN